MQRVNRAAHFRVFVCWQGADEHGIACEDSHCEEFTISIAPLNADQRREARRVWEERLWEERGCGKREAVGFAVPSRPSRGSLSEAPRAAARRDF